MRMAAVLAVLVATPVFAEAPKGAPAAPFFALCHDTHDAKKRSLAEQAALLKELGFDGAAHLWLGGVPERLKTLDDAGLKLVEIYVQVNVAPGKPPYDPKLKEVIQLLKGRDTMLGLLMAGAPRSSQDADERGVAILREIADLAATSGLRVAIYHHTGDWTERVEDAVRLVKKADRKNLGVHFNLCHWLKADGKWDLDATLKLAQPHLFVVTINGAENADPKAGWDKLIQPLGSGAFDVAGLLKKLKELGYAGPIGLMCYGLGGDAREHLTRSMAAWRKLSEQLAGPPRRGSCRPRRSERITSSGPATPWSACGSAIVGSESSTSRDGRSSATTGRASAC